MKLKLSEKILFGTVLSLLAFVYASTGVLSVSVSELSILVVAICWSVFWMIPAKIRFVMFLVAILLIFLNSAERYFWMSGTSYPSWLTSGDLSEAQFKDTHGLRARCGEPFQISYKGERAYVRCGDFWLWPGTKVWVVQKGQK